MRLKIETAALVDFATVWMRNLELLDIVFVYVNAWFVSLVLTVCLCVQCPPLTVDTGVGSETPHIDSQWLDPSNPANWALVKTVVVVLTVTSSVHVITI